MKVLLAIFGALLFLTFASVSTVAQGQGAECKTPSALMQSAGKLKLKAVHVSGEAAKRIAAALQAPLEPSDLVAFTQGGTVYIALFVDGCFKLAGRFPPDMVKGHFPTLVE